MMNVLRLRGGGNDGRTNLIVGGFVIDLAAGGRDAIGPVDGTFAHASKARQRVVQFIWREDASCCNRLSVGFAGSNFLRK